jgi:hypothetical protein
MPLRVPSVLRLVALFVSRMVLHGKAKIPHKHFNAMIVNIHTTCACVVGSNAVNGVRMYKIGKMQADIFSR